MDGRRDAQLDLSPLAQRYDEFGVTTRFAQNCTLTGLAGPLGRLRRRRGWLGTGPH